MNILIICLSIVFVVMLVWLASMTVKIRKRARILIEQIMDFGQKVNQEKFIFYSDDSANTNLIDSSGKSVPILEEEFKAADERCRIVLLGFTPDSKVPDRCYRVAYKGYECVYDDFGNPVNQINLCFRPANCCEEWVVTDVCFYHLSSYIHCHHSVMGRITLENRTKNNYVPKQKIMLRQNIQETETGRYRIDYEIV